MMKGEWIRRPQETDETSVVFVHGILSSGEECWRHDNGCYWPNLLKEEEDFERLGIYVFTYQTGFFSSNYHLGDIVDSLKEYMRLDCVLESKRLIFICHSMGGIVVRKYLVERATELFEGEREIGLFLVASPSLGSDYADWLSRLFGHAQADALRFVRENYWLKDLDREFINLKEAGKSQITGKELVEDKFVVLKGMWKALWRKQVVEPFSGARYFGEPYKVPGSDHFSIAKPKDKDAIQHRLLSKFIRDVSLSSGQEAEASPRLHTEATDAAPDVERDRPHPETSTDFKQPDKVTELKRAQFEALEKRKRRKPKVVQVVESDNVVGLDHPDPAYDAGAVSFVPLAKKFFLRFPAAVLQRGDVDWGDNRFAFRDLFLDGSGTVPVLLDDVGQARVQALLEEARSETAELFYTSQNVDTHPLFNGMKYGIAQLSIRNHPRTENSLFKAKLYRTDYFTHRVMRCLFENVKDISEGLSSCDVHSINRYPHFLTSLGLSLFIICDSEDEELVLVLRRRSMSTSNAAVAGGRWNFPVNEGATPKHGGGERFSVQEILVDGSWEEGRLGDMGPLPRFDFEPFLERNYFEVDILSLVRLPLGIGDMKSKARFARDGEREFMGDWLLLPYNESSIRAELKINAESFAPAVRYGLEALLAKGLPVPIA